MTRYIGLILRLVSIAGAAYLLPQSAGGQGASRSALTTDAGAVAGIVLNASTREPVPGLEVEVHGVTAGSSITDANGQFELAGLKPGSYRLIVKGAGFARNAMGLLTAPRLVEVGPAVKVGPIELLVHGQSVLGGRVHDSKREPLINAEVQIWSRVYQSGRPTYTVVGTQHTDDRGEFRVGGLAAGAYYVSVRPKLLMIDHRATPRGGSNDHSLSDAAVFFPSEQTIEAALPILLKPGERRNDIDVRLREIETFCVAGTLRGLGPLLNVTLQLSQYGSGWRRTLANTRLRSEQAIQICGMSPGEYYLEAATFEEQGIAGLAHEAFSIRNRDVNLETLRRTSGVALLGSITLSDGERDEPLPAGLAVDLRPIGRIAWQGEGTTAKVNSRGEFVLKNTFSYDYWLIVRHIPEGYYIKSIASGPHDGMKEPIRPEYGELRIVLAKDGASVAGSVASEDEKPLTNAYVVLAPVDLPQMGAPNLCKVQQTDQSGGFRVASLPPGEYAVMAFTDLVPGEGEYPPFLRDHLNKAQKLNLKPNSTKTVRLISIPQR